MIPAQLNNTVQQQSRTHSTGRIAPVQQIVKNQRNLLTFRLISAVLLCATCSANTAVNALPNHTLGPAIQTVTTTVFLVRHAEKAGPGDPEFAGAPLSDPPLNISGVARAEELSRTLGGADVTAIYSSPYERTRATVRPLAARLGLEVTEHPAADILGLVRLIEADNRGGVVLIAGHSDTVPSLVEALGAGPVPPIEEAWEYDNLYIVTVEATGRARVSTLKYGAVSSPGAVRERKSRTSTSIRVSTKAKKRSTSRTRAPAVKRCRAGS